MESFRANDVILSDWRERLSRASTRFTEIGQTYTDPGVELSQRVALLTVTGLTGQMELAKSVGAEVERLLGRLP